MNNKETSCRVCFVGKVGVGKTSLVTRYRTGKFDQYIDSTIGAIFASRKYKTIHGEVSINIWDTAGQERYDSLGPMYYRASDAIVMVVSAVKLEHVESLARARHYIKEIHKVITPKHYLVMINKIDAASDEEIKDMRSMVNKLFNKQKIPFVIVESSARTGEGIDLMEKRLEQFAVAYATPVLNRLLLDKSKSKKKFNCCW